MGASLAKCYDDEMNAPRESSLLGRWILRVLGPKTNRYSQKKGIEVSSVMDR